MRSSIGGHHPRPNTTAEFPAPTGCDRAEEAAVVIVEDRSVDLAA
jgi:hypothetical protein